MDNPARLREALRVGRHNHRIDLAARNERLIGIERRRIFRTRLATATNDFTFMIDDRPGAGRDDPGDLRHAFWTF